jgi:hypothetical protein
MRKLGMILGLVVAFAATPWLVHADTILFKDGFLLHGKLLRSLEPLIDPSGAAVFVPAAGKFFELDDEARRFVIVPAQVQDARSSKLNVVPDVVEIHRTRTARGGYPLDPVFEVIDASPWNQHFERTINLRVNRKGQDSVGIQQRMTLLTPHLMRVDARNYNWTAYYLTREIDPQVVLKLLRQHFDDLNQKAEKDPKQKAVNDPKENRLKICRFLSQAGWHELAEKEMAQVVKELPDLKEKVEKLRERVAKAKALLFIDALERADKAGQRLEVKRKLAQFHGENLQSLVGDKAMLQVQDLKSRVEAEDDKLKEAGRLLTAFAGRLEKTPRNEALAEAAAALRGALHAELLPRLEAFVSLGQQWEKDAKAGRAPRHNVEGVMSLALTGWLLGASAAEASPETAEKLWRARRLILRYQNTPEAVDRQNLVRSAAPDELPSPEVLAQMIRYLPPAAPHRNVNTEVQKIKLEVRGGRPIEYEVRLPPEYHPGRAYPVLVVLHSSNQRAREMLDRWAEVAAQNGYILAAPQWGGGSVFQAVYTFSPVEHAIVLNCLRDLKWRFHVDSERIFLFGAEQGGFFAYDVGLSHPSVFAGVLTMAASPHFFAEAYWSNAQHLPLYVVDGGANGAGNKANRDQFKQYVRCGYPALCVEYKGRGPEWFAGELPAMMDWMNRKKRLYPVRQVGVPGRGDKFSEEFRTMRVFDGPFYWLQAEQIAPLFLNNFANWRPLASPARVQATVAPNNRILIQTKGVTKLTVWLAPGLVDFKKKVSVQVNLANLTPVSVQPSVETLLEDYCRRGDRTHVFVAKLTVTP